jgi:3-oxoacyl-[acyl-carrier protein] reductase
MSLQGKCALVTGSSGGIGRAAAIELARRGAQVAIHYFRNRKGAEETAELVARARAGAAGAKRNGHDGKAPLFMADLSKLDEARRLVESVERAFGRLDVLVNNAGDLVQRRPLVEMTEALWREVIDTNLSSVLWCMQAAVPGMVSRKQGAIVNLSSLAAWNGGGPGALAYATAKGAVISLSKAVAKEVAPHGVRVNCVAPGLIDETTFHARFTPRDAFDNIAKGIPLLRAGKPDEVATAIAFLAGDEASFITGETVEINGGAQMR